MKTTNYYFPWQASYWNVLQQRRFKNQLPHALLFSGVKGVGKKHFADAFAYSLLCSNINENGQPCGQCRNCELFQVGHHPDCIFVEPEEEGKGIKVEQIRELVNIAAQTPQIANVKIIIVNPADKMNVNASNALLKTLEEPSGNTVIMLITDRMMSLLPTIRSRCQMIQFASPAEGVAVDWLKSQESFDQVIKEQLTFLLRFAKGAPLKVIDYLKNDELSFRQEIFQDWQQFLMNQKDLVSLSTAWNKLDVSRILLHVVSWLTDMIKINQLEIEESVLNQDLIPVLKKLSERSDLKKLYRLLDQVHEAQKLLQGPSNPNTQLLLEDLLISSLSMRG